MRCHVITFLSPRLPTFFFIFVPLPGRKIKLLYHNPSCKFGTQSDVPTVKTPVHGSPNNTTVTVFMNHCGICLPNASMACDFKFSFAYLPLFTRHIMRRFWFRLAFVSRAFIINTDFWSVEKSIKLIFHELNVKLNLSYSKQINLKSVQI